MTSYYVYKTTNLVNGKFYVGKRQYVGQIESDLYLGSGKLLFAAIAKYGENNFIKEILEICDNPETLALKETYWIEKLSATDSRIGYNITKGGIGGDTFTLNPNREQSREKNRINSTGRKHTEETKEKIRKAKEGIPFSEQHKSNLKENHKGFSGHNQSEEAKERARLLRLGQPFPKVYQCPTCDKKCSNTFNLERHYNKCKNLIKKI